MSYFADVFIALLDVLKVIGIIAGVAFLVALGVWALAVSHRVLNGRKK